MTIIKITPNENGSRPALQQRDVKTLPDGFAWCPGEFVEVFYSTEPAGFVHIEVEGDTVTAMTVNEEARAEYIAGLDDAQEGAETNEE